MPRLVNVQDVGEYSFPDEATDEQIVEFLNSQLPKPEAPRVRAPVPEAPAPSSTLRRAADIFPAIAKSVVSVPESVVGLADIPTGGVAGKLAESAGINFAETQRILSQFYSPELQQAQREIQETPGVLGKLGATLARPSTIGATVVESIGPMLTGGAIAKGLRAVKPGLSALRAAATGEAAVSGGMSAEQIRQKTEGGLLTPMQSALAAGSGVAVGIIGVLGGALANRLGVADVDVLLAGGATTASAKRVLERVVKGALAEGAFEELPQSVVEQIAQNTALGRTPTEGVADAAVQGLLAGLVTGGLVGLVPPKTTKGDEDAVPKRETAEVPLEVSPARSQQVGAQIREPIAPRVAKPTEKQIADAQAFADTALKQGWIEAEAYARLSQYFKSATVPEIASVIGSMRDQVNDALAVARTPRVPDVPAPAPTAPPAAPPPSPDLRGSLEPDRLISSSEAGSIPAPATALPAPPIAAPSESADERAARLRREVAEEERKKAAERIEKLPPPQPEPTPSQPPGTIVSQEMLRNLRARLRITKGYGINLPGIEATIANYERGQLENEPTPKSTLDALNLEIANYQRRIKGQKPVAPSAPTTTPPPSQTPVEPIEAVTESDLDAWLRSRNPDYIIKQAAAANVPMPRATKIYDKIRNRTARNQTDYTEPFLDAAQRDLEEAKRGLATTPQETPPSQTPVEPAPPAPIIQKGDWVEYVDSYGKTHQGRVNEIFTTAAIVPTRAGVITRKIRHEFSIVDADGKTMIGPADGAPLKKVEQPTQPPTQPAPTPAPAFGSQNKLFTEDAKEAALKRLREKLRRTSAGIDPTLFTDGVMVGGYFAEGGVRKFADWSAKMLAEVGEGIRPYLNVIYRAVRDWPGFDSAGMDGDAEIDRIKTQAERTPDEKPPGPTAERPVVLQPPGVAEGQPPGPAPGSDVETVGTAPSVEPGGPVGEQSVLPPAQTRKPTRGRPGIRPRGSRPGGPTATEPTPDERPGVAGSPAGGVQDASPDQNLRLKSEDELSPAARSARIQANIRAIELSKRLEKEGRLPTSEEKRVIAQFSGWGDSFQVFGLTKIGRYREAGDVYEETKKGRQLYNILYADAERKSFENWQKQYAQTYDRLKQLLTPEEWNSAKDSSLNAHYTSRLGIESLWKIIQRLGWTGGRAVEPSAGIGSMIGLTPSELAPQVQWVGVELDERTGKMLRQLYPQADIQVTGFEKSLRTENNSADLVISNFPFGNFDVLDPGHPDYDGWNIHNYFLARSVDVVRPGGLVVAITSHHTLDAPGGRKMRDWLSGRADLIGAIRLPNTAFKESAGTEVVTDILVFRKRDGINTNLGERFSQLAEVAIPQNERPTKKREDETDEQFAERISKPVFVNEYFAEHPEMVLGNHSLQGTMYRAENYTVSPGVRPLADQLTEAVARFPENVASSGQPSAPSTESTIENDQKPGRYLVRDGKIVQVDEQRRAAPVKLSATEIKAAKEMIAIRDNLTQLIVLETTEGSSDEDIVEARAELNRLYDRFSKWRGALNERINNFLDDDPEFSLLASIEDEQRTPKQIQREGKTETVYVTSYIKGPIFQKRVNFPRSEPTQAENLADALSISLSYLGSAQPDYIGRLIGVDPEKAKADLIAQNMVYENPATGLIEPPDQYLSGFVKLKLAEAQAAAAKDARFNRNVEALTKVQPAALPVERIYFRLGSNWITPEQVKRFLRSEMGVDVDVKFVRAGDETRWLVSDPDRDSTANSRTYSGGGIPAHELIQDSLNLKLTEVSVTVEDEHGNKRQVVVPDLTAAARDMQGRIQDLFRSWVVKTPDEAAEVEKTYNQLFNGMVARVFPVPKLDRFPGASDTVKLRDWQKRGSMRAVQEGTLFAHSVGTGKTYTLITTAMEMRRLAVANKPLIVVQNSTLTQFGNAFRRLYPTAKILVGNERQTAGDKRRKFIAKIATGDWDAVVVPQSFFERIENDPAREQAYVQEQIRNLEEMIRTAEGQGYNPAKRPSSPLGKQLLKVKRRFENKMNRILQRLQEKRDDVIFFENLGVDALLVDEAHNFKRGDFLTKMERVKGLDTNGSDRSMDFFLKTRWIHQRSPERNVVLATGTPISNTLAEMWTMLRYVRPQLLEKFGAGTFDDFAGTFATTVSTLEETPTGGFSQVLRLAKYVNGPELIQMWRAGADIYILNRDDFKQLGVNVPEITGGAPREIVLERPESLADFVNFLRDWRLWWENLDGKEKAELSYVPILQYGLARKAAIDLRLINPTWSDDPASKVNAVVRDVFARWKAGRDRKGTQLVFSNLYRSHDPKQAWLNEDLHLPNPLYGQPVFNVFDDMKSKLIGLGVPESEIENFTELDERERALAAERLNEGQVRIAFGSTETLGTGINAQKKIEALVHVDPQFRPMDFEQRNGRGIRQGNENATVDIDVYGVKRTLDSTLYSLMLLKQKFIAQAMSADVMSREFEDPADESTLGFQQMAAAFSGNPLFAQRFGLENEVRKLEILEDDANRKRQESRSTLKDVQDGKAKFAGHTQQLQATLDLLRSSFPDQKIASATFKGQTATGDDARKLLEAVLTEAVGEMEANLNEQFASGELARNFAENIKRKKKGIYEPNIIRQRTRLFEINGLPFTFDLQLEAGLNALSEGRLEIVQRNGGWKLADHRSAYWTDNQPWNIYGVDVGGSATTALGFESSLRSDIRTLGEKAGQIEAGDQRINKTIEDLKRELDRPFEFSARLQEQREKLADVLKELEATGATTAKATPPGIDEITQRHSKFAYLTRRVAAEMSDDALIRIRRDQAEKQKKTFYIISGDGKHEAVKGGKPIQIPSHPWLNAFVREDKKAKLWIISSTDVGVRLKSGDTAALALKDVEEQLKSKSQAELQALIQDFGIKHGLTPRAEALDAEKFQDLSPFQTGRNVKFGWEGSEYTGVIKGLDPAKARVTVTIADGRDIIVPLRYVEPIAATPVEPAAPSASYAAPTGGSTVDQIRAEALDFLGVSELPANVLVINDPSKPYGAVIEGRNQITLNAARIAPGTTAQVLLEEGLHGVWFDPAVQQAWQSVQASVTATDIAAERQKRGELDVSDEALREEAAIAKLTNRTTWRQLWDAIVAAFRRVFGWDVRDSDALRQAAMSFLRDGIPVQEAMGQSRYAAPTAGVNATGGPNLPPEGETGTVGRVFQRAVSEEFGRKTEFADAAKLTPEGRAEGGRYTERELANIGLPTIEFETANKSRMFTNEAWQPNEQAGQRLLERHAYLMDHAAELYPDDGIRAGVLGTWINSLRNILGTMAERRATGQPVTFSEALQNDLRGLVQGEARFWGQLLASLRGMSGSILWAVRNADAILRTMRGEAFGAPAVNRFLQILQNHFRDQWTVEQVTRLVKDTRLASRLSAIARIDEPTLADLVHRTLQTPVRHIDQFGEVFARLLSNQLGIPASNAAEKFNDALGVRLKNALSRAREGAWEGMEKNLRRSINKRTPLWRRLEAVLQDGNLDFDDVIAKIAERDGWEVPTPEEIARLQALATREMELRTLPQATADQIAALPKDQQEAAREAAQTELNAATDSERAELIKRMNVTWSRWTRPISWRAYLPRALGGQPSMEVVQNNAQAINEWITANLLLKFGFFVRQTIDVGVQTLMHDPTRALATAMLTHKDELARGVFTADFWADAGAALKTAFDLRTRTMRHALAAARQGLRGRGIIKHSEQITHRLDIFERMMQQADRMAEEGKPGQAFALRLVTWVRSALLFSRALDLLSTTGVEYVEIGHRIRMAMREQGKSRAEIDQQLDLIFGDMKAQWVDAYSRAQQIFSTKGIEPTRANLDEAAWNIVRARAYTALKAIDSKSDNFQAVAEDLANTLGWNEREVAGVGGVVGGLMRNIQRGGESMGIPTAFISAFGNAIATNINRKLVWLGLGKLAQFGGESPWYRTELDREQRLAEGFIGAGTSAFLASLVLMGAVAVRGFWPRDEKEREKWRIEGRRPGTLEIPTGDGNFVTLSLSVGPAALIAPALVSAGQIRQLVDDRAKKQKVMDEEATKRGVAPGKIEPLGAGDFMATAANALWASLVNARTISGVIGAATDQGVFEPKKLSASAISALTPGLPGWQDIMRVAGVYMNPRLATLGDMLVPMPGSPARRVNVLGDPSGSFDQTQQIIQTLTGGTYLAPVNPKLAQAQPAYEALFHANWVPSPPIPSKGYAIDGVYRPMTRSELQNYTELRGKLFARELEAVALTVTALPQAEAKRIVQEAFQRANQQALRRVGVDVEASTVPRASASADGPQVASRLAPREERPARISAASSAPVPASAFESVTAPAVSTRGGFARLRRGRGRRATVRRGRVIRGRRARLRLPRTRSLRRGRLTSLRL